MQKASKVLAWIAVVAACISAMVGGSWVYAMLFVPNGVGYQENIVNSFLVPLILLLILPVGARLLSHKKYAKTSLALSLLAILLYCAGPLLMFVMGAWMLTHGY